MRTGTLICNDKFTDSRRGDGKPSSRAVVSKIRVFWPFTGTIYRFVAFSRRHELRAENATCFALVSGFWRA